MLLIGIGYSGNLRCRSLSDEAQILLSIRQFRHSVATTRGLMSFSADSTVSHGLRNLFSKFGGWSAVRPALRYDLCAREEADAVLAILVKVAES
jgi:hypothetical protein